MVSEKQWCPFSKLATYSLVEITVCLSLENYKKGTELIPRMSQARQRPQGKTIKRQIAHRKTASDPMVEFNNEIVSRWSVSIFERHIYQTTTTLVFRVFLGPLAHRKTNNYARIFDRNETCYFALRWCCCSLRWRTSHVAIHSKSWQNVKTEIIEFFFVFFCFLGFFTVGTLTWTSRIQLFDHVFLHVSQRFNLQIFKFFRFFERFHLSVPHWGRYWKP